MIYITGDTHGDIDIGKLSGKNFPDGKNLKREDYVIVLGDFGLPFLDKEVGEDGRPVKGPYKYWIDWLSERPYTILWIDGNHDNFNFWKRQEISDWHGGKVQVHPHADNVIHLMRGEIYRIDGKSFLAFGGAPSHDKHLRIDQVSWWPEEEASTEEMQYCLDNAEKHGGYVDYILTHTIPKNLVQSKFHFESESPTESFLNVLQERVGYHMWFAGHFHQEILLPYEQMMLFYNRVASLDECERQLKQHLKVMDDYCR